MLSDLSIIIVTYNSAADIRLCLNSINENARSLNYDIMVVDNASQDSTRSILKQEYPNIRVVANSDNAGFPAANNQAMALCEGKKILLLNPDTLVHASALQDMAKYLDEHKECGICGAQLVDAKGMKADDLLPLDSWKYIVQLLSGGLVRFGSLPANRQLALSGACLMFHKDLIETIGWLDENMFWGEDLDYCVRTRLAGMAVCKVPGARVTHFVGQSTKSNLKLYLSKQYYSKINYLRQHAHRSTVIGIATVYIIECWLRLIKWTLISTYRNDKEAQIRRQCFLALVADLPKELFR